MPRARKGPSGPKRGAGGMPGNNKRHRPAKGSSGSGASHNSAFRKAAKRPKGY